jgi:hypothetical protein
MKEIEKTKEMQIENLKKTVEVLKGKYSEGTGNGFEEEIE